MNDIQQRLNALYSQFKSVSGELDRFGKDLSAPLLLKIPEMWLKSTPRLLIVGQETRGWGCCAENSEGFRWPWESVINFAEFLAFSSSIEALVDLYGQFEFALHNRKNYSRPFWKAYRQIRRAIDGTVDGFETSVLWTNLWRMDYQRCPVHTHSEVKMPVWNLQKNMSLLAREISILEARGVIFFVGRNNWWFLKDAFPDLEIRRFGNFDEKVVSWVSARGLPQLSAYTYHPAYLARLRRWDVIDALEREFSSALR